MNFRYAMDRGRMLSLTGVVGVLTAFLPNALGGSPANASIDGIRALDVAGGRHQFGQDGRFKATVFTFLSTECPICQQYVPELNRLAQTAKDMEIDFFAVVSDPVQKRAAVAAFAKEYGVQFPVLFDDSGELAQRMQPTHTPEAFVVDSSGAIAYRGRIDDLYPKPGRKRAAASSHDLQVAMKAIAAGEPIAIAKTEPVGCRFERSESASASGGAVTFARHIAPIFYANCTECHRPGEVAPFSLIGYLDASKRADWIAENVQNNVMPPWKAAEGYGHFVAERRLTPRQKQLIEEWAKAGAPKGDDDDMPTLPKYPDGWLLGEPDVVLDAPHSVTVPAEGPDLFHHFVLPLNLPEDATAVAVEFRPGNPKIVHHAIVFLDTTGSGRKKDAATPEPGFTTKTGTAVPLAGVLNIWAPGVAARPLPKGVGQKLPKNADIIVQLHLHPNGKVETDKSKVGIYFTKEPVSRYVMDRPFVYGPVTIDIPPGKQRHEMAATMELPIDLTLTAVLPHMHLIGKEMKVWATLPNGEDKPLVWIKDWNFYWQDQYVYRDPIRLPKGTVIHVEGVYDNSAGNPLNPSSPPQRVLLGEESNNEMCLALFQVIGDKPDDQWRIRNSVVSNVFRQLKSPDVTDELRQHTIDMLRQSAGAEFQGLLSERLTQLLQGKEKGSNRPPVRNVQ